MEIVSEVLSVACSNLQVRARRSGDWRDGRRGPRSQAAAELATEITTATTARPSFGYRRAQTPVNRRRDHDGRRRVNHKRVYRAMREYHLLLRRHTGRLIDTRSHDGRNAVGESDRHWCSDGFEIACDRRERVRIDFVLDCRDREAMIWASTTGSVTGEMVRDLMVEAMEARFGTVAPAQPIEWLTDNGSPYVARDARSFAREIGMEPLTTAIASPQSNGMAESFVKTFKRDYGDRADCSDGFTVLHRLEAALEHYNEVHPHQALKMLSLRMFRRRAVELSIRASPEI
jgi:putative transposase